jgi:hypothetical protein
MPYPTSPIQGEINATIHTPTTNRWLKIALTDALCRDCANATYHIARLSVWIANLSLRSHFRKEAGNAEA